MKPSNDKHTTKRGPMARLALLAAIIGLAGISAFAQTELVAANKVQETRPASMTPMVTELRGVTIGMAHDQVNDKLGKAKVADEFSLYYDFSDGESMQIALDADKKVKMAAMMYMGEKADAPEYAEVFGSDVALKQEVDGRIYNLVRYPDAGFWVAYSRLMVGDKPMTTVTIQTMN